MRPFHPNFRIAAISKPTPIRTLVEAQAEQRADIRRTKAQFQTADSFVARAADFTSANSLVAAAQTVEAALTNAPAGNALYEAHFRVTINPIIPATGTNTHKVTVAVETDPTGAAAWTEQWTFDYEVVKKVGEPGGPLTWPSERMPVRVQGFNSSGKLRLKIKSASGPSGWSFSVHGFNLATDGDVLSGVTYHTGPAMDFLDGGQGVTLADTKLSKLSHASSDGYEFDLGGPALSKDVAPFIVARTVWGKDDSKDIAIDRFTAQLHPQVDGGQPKDVAWFVLQPFALIRSGPTGLELGNPNVQTEIATDMVPLCAPVRVPAGDGTSAQDYVFSFYDRDIVGPGHNIVTLLRKPRPKSITPRFGGSPVQNQNKEYDSSPTTFWFIWALTATGAAASNVGWARDSAVTEVVNGSRKLRTVQVRKLAIYENTAKTAAVSGWWVEAPTTLSATARPVFRCKIECGSYANANLEFTGANLLDLGATPTQTVEFRGVAAVPSGCDSIFEVRNDADSAWLPFTDGQTAAQVGVSQRQTYKVRWRALTNANTDATPTLWEIGVRDVKKIWLSDLLAGVNARWNIPDVAELVPAIPEFEFTFIKNGERDFNDRITKLLSENTLGSLAFRVWRGDPSKPRAEWLHIDDAPLVDDYDPTESSVSVIAHSPIVYLKGALPVYNTTTQQRTPLQIANRTPKQAYEEIVNNQLAPDVAGRFKGEGITDESVLLSKTIEDSDGETEVNAIAHIVGVVVSSSAGVIKQFPMFGPGAVQVVFSSEKIQWRSTSPGMRQRVPRFFVKYNYEPTSGSYGGEVRLISANDILASNLQPSRIDARIELRDEVCRWIPTEQLAKVVGQRRVDALGAGMLVWRFTSTEPHPELEFGDIVAVETDRFFARDPSQVSQKILKGQLWAVARVIEHNIDGTEFGVWIQSYTDILGAADASVLVGYQPASTLAQMPVSGTFAYNANTGVSFGALAWSWVARTIYRPDGSTVAIPASTSIVAPAAPTLAQVAGGALGARTYYVRIAYVKVTSSSQRWLYSVSAESSLAVSANNLLKVTAPPNPGGYDNWCVLVGTSANAEFTQGAGNITLLNFGSDWTEPVGGATTSATTPFNTNWVGKVVGCYLDFSKTYYHYPYWDLSFAQPEGIKVVMNRDFPSTSPSLSDSQGQLLNGHIPLSLQADGSSPAAVVGYIKGVTPAASGSSSDSGLGGKF